MSSESHLILKKKKLLRSLFRSTQWK